MSRQFRERFSDAPTRKLVKVLQQAVWMGSQILELEKQDFEARTQLAQLRPDSQVSLTTPGLYNKLVDHIEVHRWYLGQQHGEEISFDEAVSSWYDNVYLPLVEFIREQGILGEFPGRTETDLYLWILEQQNFLVGIYGGEVTLKQALNNLMGPRKQN